MIEALAHRRSDQLHELGSVAHLVGSGTHVVEDVELRVVDPGRGGEPQGGRRQALPGGGTSPSRASTRLRTRSTVSGTPSGAASTIASFRVWPAMASDSSRRIRVSSALSRSKRLKFARWRGARAAPNGHDFLRRYGTYKVISVQARAFTARLVAVTAAAAAAAAAAAGFAASGALTALGPSAFSPLGRSAYHSAPN